MGRKRADELPASAAAKLFGDDDEPESGTAEVATEGSESGTSTKAPILSLEVRQPLGFKLDVQDGTTLVRVDDGGLFKRILEAPPSAEALDAAMVAIRQLDRGGAKCAWATAKLLAHVKDRLWQTRMDRYKGFEPWVEQAAGMSRRHADRLIKLSEHFTEQDFETFGVSKLLVLLKVTNEDAVDDLKSMLTANPRMSTRQLAEEVEAMKPKPEPANEDGHDVHDAGAAEEPKESAVEPPTVKATEDKATEEKPKRSLSVVKDSKPNDDAKPTPTTPKAKTYRVLTSGRREDKPDVAHATIEVEGKRITIEIDIGKRPDKWRAFESADGGEE